MEKITMSYSQFAFSVGSSDRLTQEFSTGWHLEYVKADSDTRQARRTEFMVNYLMGNLKITKAVAERILSTSRDKRSKVNQQAVWRASDKFKYHIIRPDGKKKGAVSSQQDIVEKALELVESMTKAQQQRFRNRVSYKK